MIKDIQALVENYFAWLKEETILRQVGDFVEITTPYLDRHNDYLQVYVKHTDDGFVLTDDGYVLDDLELSGCKINSPKRKELLKVTLNGFGVNTDGNALEIKASSEDFPLKKHNLVQAMLAVSDLFYLATPSDANLFHKSVKEWLDLSGIRYKTGDKFIGKSGFNHHFDFVIPESKVQPERVLRIIKQPNRHSAQAIAFDWSERKRDFSKAQAYAILNDTEQGIPGTIMDAISNSGVHPIPWSKRGEVQSVLAE